MKKISIIILAFTALVFTGCSLNESPENQKGTGDVNNPTDLEGLALSMYSGPRGYFTGSRAYIYDLLTDLFNETQTSGNRSGFFSRHEIMSNDQTVTSVWAEHYTEIMRANLLLTKADAVLAAYPASETQINNNKGEAYLWRAIMHRRLALIFCKDYEPATAASDYGIPYVDVYDIAFRTGRGTLESLYQNILDDIQRAEQYLTRAGAQNATRLNVDCITALKAQVYLDMHNYGAAVTEANKLISSYPLATSAADLDRMWVNDSSTETIFQVAMVQSTETGNDNSDIASGRLEEVDEDVFEFWGSPGYAMTKNLVDKFDLTADWRVGTYIEESTIELSNDPASPRETGYLLRKFRGAVDLRASIDAFNYQSRPKLFRVADMYLIKAEAEYRQNGGGLGTLNDFRAGRGLPALTVTGNAILTAIQDERAKEFVGEGHRAADMKRWQASFTRVPQFTDAILGSSTAPHTMTVNWNDTNMLMPIPHREFGVNPHLVGHQNPGYAE